jgi:hypothetical protein
VNAYALVRATANDRRVMGQIGKSRGSPGPGRTLAGRQAPIASAGFLYESEKCVARGGSPRTRGALRGDPRPVETDRDTCLSHMVVITTPSSQISRPLGSTPGFVNGLEGLFRWLLFNRLPAGVTQTILPPVPALEDVITAQAGGEPGIRGGGRFVPSVSRALTHACAQRYTGDRRCSWRREVPRAQEHHLHESSDARDACLQGAMA